MRRKADKVVPKLWGALVGATCFTIMGALFPVLRANYVSDDTVYFQYLENPMKTDKPTYRPCQPVISSVQRESLVVTEGTFFRDLILVKTDSNGQENFTDIYQTKTTNSIVEGRETRNLVFQLPCTLNDGLYFIRGLVTFGVKGKERTYNWTSERFQVVNPPDEVDLEQVTSPTPTP